MWLRLAFRSRCTSRCRARCGSATPFCSSPRRDRASSTLTCPGAHRACTTAVCLSAACVRTASSALAPRSMQRHFSWPFTFVGSSVLACTMYYCIVSYFSSDGPERCCAGRGSLCVRSGLDSPVSLLPIQPWKPFNWNVGRRSVVVVDATETAMHC